MRLPELFLLVAYVLLSHGVLAAEGSAERELLVAIATNKRVYIPHEPVVCRILVRNSSGSEVTTPAPVALYLRRAGEADWQPLGEPSAGDTTIGPIWSPLYYPPRSLRAGEEYSYVRIVPAIGAAGAYELLAALDLPAPARDIRSAPIQIEAREPARPDPILGVLEPAGAHDARRQRVSIRMAPEGLKLAAPMDLPRFSRRLAVIHYSAGGDLGEEERTQFNRLVDGLLEKHSESVFMEILTTEYIWKNMLRNDEHGRKAVQLAENFHSRYPDSFFRPEILVQQYGYWRRQGDPAKAAAVYDKGRELDGTSLLYRNPASLMAAAETYLEAGRVDDAERTALEAKAKLRPDSTWHKRADEILHRARGETPATSRGTGTD